MQHQQQVAVAVERAKQITMAELNAVMQVASHHLYLWYYRVGVDLDPFGSVLVAGSVADPGCLSRILIFKLQISHN